MNFFQFQQKKNKPKISKEGNFLFILISDREEETLQSFNILDQLETKINNKIEIPNSSRKITVSHKQEFYLTNSISNWKKTRESRSSRNPSFGSFSQFSQSICQVNMNQSVISNPTFMDELVNEGRQTFLKELAKSGGLVNVEGEFTEIQRRFLLNFLHR